MHVMKDVSHSSHVQKIINMTLHIIGVHIPMMLTVDQGSAMTQSTAQIVLMYSKMEHFVPLSEVLLFRIQRHYKKS